MKVLNYRILLRNEPEGGYTVTVPSLPGCVTYGATLEEARAMAKEAVEIHLESLRAHGDHHAATACGWSALSIVRHPATDSR